MCVYVDVLRGVCVCLCVFMCMSLGVRVCLCVCPVTPEGRPQPYGHYGPAQDLAVWLPSITANAHTSIEVMNRAPAEGLKEDPLVLIQTSLHVDPLLQRNCVFPSTDTCPSSCDA